MQFKGKLTSRTLSGLVWLLWPTGISRLLVHVMSVSTTSPMIIQVSKLRQKTEFGQFLVFSKWSV
jgi:hypothetical protein